MKNNATHPSNQQTGHNQGSFEFLFQEVMNQVEGDLKNLLEQRAQIRDAYHESTRAQLKASLDSANMSLVDLIRNVGDFAGRLQQHVRQQKDRLVINAAKTVNTQQRIYVIETFGPSDRAGSLALGICDDRFTLVRVVEKSSHHLSSATLYARCAETEFRYLDSARLLSLLQHFSRPTQLLRYLAMDFVQEGEPALFL